MILEPNIITAPLLPGVFLQEFREQQRITHEDEDTTLDTFLASATQNFQWLTGRTLWDTTYEVALDGVPCGSYVLLPCGYPLIEIVSIKYKDSTGVETTWGTSNYVSDEWGRVAPAYGISWPSFTPYPLACFRIRYRAGLAYSSPQTAWPEDGIRQCIMEMAGAMYLNREQFTPTDRAAAISAFAENPMTRRLLEKYKVRYAF